MLVRGAFRMAVCAAAVVALRVNLANLDQALAISRWGQ